MKTIKTLLFGACLWAALAAGAAPGDVLRFALPGWVELELVEVGGESMLPLEGLYTGKNRDRISRVKSPRYWIGKFEVMQKQYQAVMNDNPSGQKSDDRLPVTGVKWKEAVEFCDRLNYVCKGEIPPGYRFDLPTLVEWAHAFGAGSTNVYKYAGSDEIEDVAWHGIGGEDNAVRFSSLHVVGMKDPNDAKIFDMSGNVAEYVFIIDQKGGNMRMGGSYMFPERYCELQGTTMVAKGAEAPDLGFRVALVPLKGYDPDGQTITMGTKGRILLRAGCADLARKYLSEALEIEDIAPAETERIHQSWLEADKACGYYEGTWSDLMTQLSVKLDKNGFQMNDIFDFWGMETNDVNYVEAQRHVRKLYREAGVFGGMMNAKDLPTVVQERFDPSLSKKVQALSCDFTGDGLKDLVVEIAGKTDTNGELYGFFERLPKGGYRIVGEPIRTVGLCVLPNGGKQVLFLTMVKLTGDVLAPGVMDCTIAAGKPCLRIAWPLDKSYNLCDLVNEQVHPQLPFMGKRNAIRARHIAEGDYKRPLCWPWRR